MITVVNRDLCQRTCEILARITHLWRKLIFVQSEQHTVLLLFVHSSPSELLLVWRGLLPPILVYLFAFVRLGLQRSGSPSVLLASTLLTDHLVPSQAGPSVLPYTPCTKQSSHLNSPIHADVSVRITSNVWFSPVYASTLALRYPHQ